VYTACIKLAILQDDSANNQCTSVGIKRSHIAQERILNEICTRTFTFMVNETLANERPTLFSNRKKIKPFLSDKYLICQKHAITFVPQQWAAASVEAFKCIITRYDCTYT
jgi:hypothetical protein